MCSEESNTRANPVSRRMVLTYNWIDAVADPKTVAGPFRRASGAENNSPQEM